jgi:hypothetical protein
MNDALGVLYIQTIRARLELERIIAASPMESMESPQLTVPKKRAAFRQSVEVDQ